MIQDSADDSRDSETREETPRAPKLVTPAQYAAHRGVSRIAVMQALARGRLTSASANQVGKRWKIDVAAADEEWARNTRQRRNVNDASGLDQVEVAEAIRPLLNSEGGLVVGPNEIPVDEDGKPLPPTLVAAWKTSVEAQIKTLELARLRGSLVPADLAAQRLDHVGRMVRDSILSVGARIAHLVASEADPAQCEIILERELTGALLALVPDQLRN